MLSARLLSLQGLHVWASLLYVTTNLLQISLQSLELTQGAGHVVGGVCVWVRHVEYWGVPVGQGNPQGKLPQWFIGRPPNGVCDVGSRIPICFEPWLEFS